MKDKINFFFILICLISILSFLYTFYNSNFRSNSENIVYYVISSILFFGSIASIFFSKIIKKYILILTFSFICSLYLYEFYTIFYLYGIDSYKQKINTLSKLDFYLEQKKIDKSTVIAVPNTIKDSKVEYLFPLSGVSNSNTIHCNESGYFSTYKSDRYGFNNPDSEWDSNKIDYLLIGDSFVHGACVNRNNDIASVIRKNTKSNVLNLGISGSGLYDYYAILREYKHKNTTKILLFYFEGNDLGDFLDNNYKNINNQLKKYLNNNFYSQGLRFRQKEIDDYYINLIKKNILDQSNQEIYKYNYFFNFVKLWHTRSAIKFTVLKYKEIFNKKKFNSVEFKKILNLLNNYSKNNNAELYFVYLPALERYRNSYNDKIFKRLEIKSAVLELKIKFIDIHEEVFLKINNPLKLFASNSLYGKHYNITGYERVAKSVIKIIDQN